MGIKSICKNNSAQDCAIILLSKFISENELAVFTKTILKIRNILISLGYVDI